MSSDCPFFCVDHKEEAVLISWEIVLQVLSVIVRGHHWPPFVFNEMYIDEVDANGIIFWYKDIEDEAKQK